MTNQFVYKIGAACAAALSLVLAVSPSSAQLAINESCVKGDVSSYDWAELSQDFMESSWDRKATLRLVSDYEELTLKVLDLNNQSVCENVADLRTSCTWNLNQGAEYNVVIDNTMRATSTTYELCAR